MSHRQISTSWWQPANFLGHTQLLFEIYWECGSFPSRYLDKIWMLFLLLVAWEMKSLSNFASPGDWQAIKAMIHGPKLPAASSLLWWKRCKYVSIKVSLFLSSEESCLAFKPSLADGLLVLPRPNIIFLVIQPGLNMSRPNLNMNKISHGNAPFPWALFTTHPCISGE